MRVTFLGTAGAIPMAHRSNTSILVQSDTYSVLVDCSGNVWGNLLRSGMDPLKLDAVIITHGHVDHTYGIPSLVEVLKLQGRQDPLRLYVQKHAQPRIQAILEAFDLTTRQGCFPIIIIPIPHEPISFFLEQGLTISAFPLQHVIPNMGLKFRTDHHTIAYVCDTQPFKSLSGFIDTTDLLVHECISCYALREPTPWHSLAKDAGILAQSVKASRLALVHLLPEMDAQRELAVNEAKTVFSGQIVIPDDGEYLDFMV